MIIQISKKNVKNFILYIKKIKKTCKILFINKIIINKIYNR